MLWPMKQHLGPDGGPLRPRARATADVLRGLDRARESAQRCGTGLRERRQAAGLTQAEAARRARISQPRWSELERGLGADATLETWARAASAVGEQLVCFLERAPGSGLPRDIEHVRRQNEIVRRAIGGDWTVAPEMPLSIGRGGRVVDILLTRPRRREASVVEVWDWLADVGAALRSLDEKVAAVRGRLPGWRVQGAWVVRGTRRNRRLVGELEPLLGARFPGSSVAWLAALESPDAELPAGATVAWTDATATSLRPGRPGRGRSDGWPGQATPNATDT